MFSGLAMMTQSSWASELAKILHRMSGKAEEETALDAATKCALDYFSVVIAGFTEAVAVEVKETADMLGEAEMATVLCGGAKTSAPLAALANGTAAHALDFDDTLWTYIGHCTAVIFSSALAVAEWLDCDGLQLLKGFTLGVEASHRIGSPVVDHLTQRGWHPTPVVGVFGAAAACSFIMRHHADQLTSALTLATNLAGGLRQNFGSKVKPLASGWSAHCGVMAAILAQQGISGSADAFEGRQGYFYAFSGHVPSSLPQSINQPLALVSPGPGFKLYPCCTGTHPAIEAILTIQREHAVPPDAVGSIRIEVTPEVLGELIYPVPSTGRQAKFSLPYCAALALTHGRVGIEHFSDEMIRDPEILAVMPRVSISPTETLTRLGGDHCPAARVTLVTRDGRIFERTVHAARGNPGNPAELEDFKNKYFECAASAGLTGHRAESLLRQILNIRKIASIRGWMKDEVVPVISSLIG